MKLIFSSFNLGQLFNFDAFDRKFFFNLLRLFGRDQRLNLLRVISSINICVGAQKIELFILGFFLENEGFELGGLGRVGVEGGDPGCQFVYYFFDVRRGHDHLLLLLRLLRCLTHCRRLLVNFSHLLCTWLI